ncbi:hypothetical protein ACOME3_000743 [Neoechinorhynchus agilis]
MRFSQWIREWNVTERDYYYSSLVVGLNPDTHYRIRLRSFNKFNEGPESDFFEVRTLRSPPLVPPTFVRIKRQTESSALIGWTAISTSQHEEPILGYEVVTKCQTFTESNRLVTSSEQEVEIELIPSEICSIRVRGYSAGGRGMLSSPALAYILDGDGKLYTSEVNYLN